MVTIFETEEAAYCIARRQRIPWTYTRLLDLESRVVATSVVSGYCSLDSTPCVFARSRVQRITASVRLL